MGADASQHDRWLSTGASERQGVCKLACTTPGRHTGASNEGGNSIHRRPRFVRHACATLTSSKLRIRSTSSDPLHGDNRFSRMPSVYIQARHDPPYRFLSAAVSVLKCTEALRRLHSLHRLVEVSRGEHFLHTSRCAPTAA